MSVPIYLKRWNVSTFKATPGFKREKVLKNQDFVFAGSALVINRHCTLSEF